MVANALAIAARELRLGAAGREAERAALAALLGPAGALWTSFAPSLPRDPGWCLGWRQASGITFHHAERP